MKRAHSLVVASISVVLGWAALSALAQETEDLSAASMSAPASDAVAQAIDAIRQAREPSEAVQAYAQGAAFAPDDVALAEAYLRRMVDFHVPEMATAQAERLVKRDPNNGLAWAVSAYANAARGRMTQALEEIVTAVARAHDEPFVQQTAGHLLAWYGARANRSDFPATLQHDLEQVRTDLADQEVFKDAYREARDFYQQSGTTTQPPAYTPPAEYGPDYSAPPAVAYPPYYGPDYGLYAAPYYPTYPLIDTYSYFPFPSVSVFSDVFFVGRHHRFHDRDDFFHHRFDGFFHRDRDDFFRNRIGDSRHGVGVGFGSGAPRVLSRNGFVDRGARVGSREGAVLGPGRGAVTAPRRDMGGLPRNLPAVTPSMRPPTISGPRSPEFPRAMSGPRGAGGLQAPRGTVAPPAFHSMTVPRGAPSPSFGRPPATRFSAPSRGFAPAPQPMRSAPSFGTFRSAPSSGSFRAAPSFGGYRGGGRAYGGSGMRR